MLKTNTGAKFMKTLLATGSGSHTPSKARSSIHDYFLRIDDWLMERIYDSVGRSPIRLRLGKTVEVSPADAFPIATIVIQDRKTVLDLLLDAELGFGEGYSDGRILVEGDLVAFLEAVYRSISTLGPRYWYTKLISRGLSLAKPNSLAGARKNIHQHYDLSNDFFRLWLDSQLLYSCAYFANASMSLEDAQIAKMDYICRKLNLQRGEHVVDIGSGWGALGLYMAKHYGVSVRGFSISHEQVCWARERAEESGLNQQVEFIEDDYRNISEKCDVIVSVGMLEHVGPEHYAEMGHIIDRSLAPAGRGLLQSVGRNQPRPFSPWTIKRIFPGAYAPSLGQIMGVFEPSEFSILDVENLRHHYAKTAEHWLERFENSTKKVAAMFGPDFVRMWRLYLAGTVAGFHVGTLQLFQIVFARNDSVQMPITRSHLYRQDAGASQQMV
jgi:cyclopropane-fatty-acyl-phospholipid synthase